VITGELRIALAGIVALVSLVAFEALAVSTAMPVVATELGGLRHYGLAFSLFLTTSLLGMVLAGGWTDARGPLAPTVAGMAAFCAGLVVSGTASTFAVMLAGRVVAGLGGGILVVCLYVVVGAVFAEEARPTVFAWMSSGWVLPALVGPPLAGWLAGQVTWRLVFLLVPPLALLALAVLGRRLAAIGAQPGGSAEGGPAQRRRRLLLGLALAAGAALAQAGASALVPLRALPVLALVAGLALVAASLPRLLPAGTLRAARGLPSVVAVRGLLTACFAGAEAYVPLMLVLERGLSVTVAGLALTGGAVGWAAGSFAQSRPGMRVPRHRLLSTGGVVISLVVAALALPSLHLLPALAVPVLWAVAGAGMGLALSSTGVLVLAMAPAAERGRASSALQLSDALGSVVGIAAAGAVLAARTGEQAAHGAGAAASATGPDDGGLTFAVIFAGLAVAGVAAAVVGARARPASPTGAGPAAPTAPGPATSPNGTPDAPASTSVALP